MHESIPTGPDSDERAKRLESTVLSTLDNIAARYAERSTQSIVDILQKYDLPDRSVVPSMVDGEGNPVARLSSPTTPLYRSLPEEFRKYRNPDADHWGAEFIRGVVQNDGAQRAQAAAKLEGMFPELSRADTLEGAADASGGFAAGTGGVLLPRPLENLVAIARDRIAKMYRFATTYQMTAQEHNIPTGTAMTSYMVGEATSPVTQGEPTYAQVPLIAYRGCAKAILGNDLMEDAAFNIVNFLTMRGGASLAALEDTEFFQTGTGSSPHVTKLSGTAYSENTSGSLGYQDVVGIYSALGQVYRGNAVWFIASNVLALMANVRDGQGRPFYQSLLDPPMALTDNATGGMMAGAQGTLLGRPVHDVPLTNGDVWFGDPSACYAIGRRQGIRVEMSREVYFETFRTVMLLHQRFAGNNVDTAGAQYCTGITGATSL